MGDPMNVRRDGSRRGSGRAIVTRQGTLVALGAVLGVFVSTIGVAHAALTAEQKCAVAKGKAAGKMTSAELKCRAHAFATGGASADPACLSAVETRYNKAIASADAKGGCKVTGDASAIDGAVKSCVDAIVALTPITPLPIWFVDADGDGYGDLASSGVSALTQPPGYVANDGDCDDHNASIHPGATEIPGNGIDENCDARESCFLDADHDGHGSTTVVSSDLGDFTCSHLGVAQTSDDCDDFDPTTHPGATDIPGNNVDEDCDGHAVCFADADNDGCPFPDLVISPTTRCDGPFQGTQAELDACVDCDDVDPARHPGATEVCDPNNTDEDCNGLADDADPGATGQIPFYRDTDGDGYGGPDVIQRCDPPSGYTANPGDCDDGNPAIHPGAIEVCNGLDDDCDGVIDGAGVCG